MPRTSNLSPENLLRFLQVKTEPASANDIARGLHLGKSDRRHLFKILTKLKKRNAIEELPGADAAVSKTRALAVCTRRGISVVRKSMPRMLSVAASRFADG